MLRLVSSENHEFQETAEAAGLPEEAVKGDTSAAEYSSFDDMGQEDEDLSLLDDLDIELADESIEDLCPGLSQGINSLLMEESATLQEENRPNLRECRQSRKKVAVFMGRCHRCDGYMLNDRERQFSITDEEVYRCVSCGWRTSPVYAFNQVNR